MKLPAIQFYPGDWHKDQGVQALDLEHRGAWFEMLLMMHDSDERGVLLINGVPMPEPVIARRLGLDNQKFNQILTTLLTYGVASRREEDGAIYSRRMVKDEKLRQIRTEAGKKGGNPNLVNQKTKQKATTGVKQNPTPSITSSITSSSSNNVLLEKEPKGEGNPEIENLNSSEIENTSNLENSENSDLTQGGGPAALKLPFQSDAFASLWETWKTHRKAIKKQYKSLQSEQAALNQLSGFEEEFASDLINRSIANGWQGLIFSGTAKDYEEFKKRKHGITYQPGKPAPEATKPKDYKTMLENQKNAVYL